MLNTNAPNSPPSLVTFIFFFSAIFLMFTAFNYSIKTTIKISNVSSTTLNHKLTWKW